MRRLLIWSLLLTLVLTVLLAGCQQRGPIDLEALAGKARAGEAQAYRKLVELLNVEQGHLNDRVYAVILDLGPSAIPYLREKIAVPSAKMREYVIAALGNLKDQDGVQPIAKVLADTTLKRRYIAAWALGEIGNDAGIPPLIKALGDANAEVRKAATRSLIKFDRAAEQPLIAALKNSTGEAQAAAVRALGDIGQTDALPALLPLADGPQRKEVFLALGKLKDRRGEKALIKGLKDPDWQVRMNAAMALGPVGSKASVAPLKITLEDDVHVVREWSARSLEMITGTHMLYRNAKGEYVPPYNIYH